MQKKYMGTGKYAKKMFLSCWRLVIFEDLLVVEEEVALTVQHLQLKQVQYSSVGTVYYSTVR